MLPWNGILNRSNGWMMALPFWQFTVHISLVHQSRMTVQIVLHANKAKEILTQHV
jgi:hypothetical protein